MNPGLLFWYVVCGGAGLFVVFLFGLAALLVYGFVKTAATEEAKK